MTGQHHLIPNDVREAFEGAVGAFQHWDYGAPEPGVFYKQQSVSIDSVCDLAAAFSGEVSDSVFDVVRKLAAEFNTGVPVDKSYQIVALCMYRLVQSKRDHIKHRAQQLKERG
jgi:hypothetical protein